MPIESVVSSLFSVAAVMRQIAVCTMLLIEPATLPRASISFNDVGTLVEMFLKTFMLLHFVKDYLLW